MKTYQLANEGPYGIAKKIAPMTNELVKNQLNCFSTPGSPEDPVEAQGILPDISNFKAFIFYDFLKKKNNVFTRLIEFSWLVPRL